MPNALPPNRATHIPPPGPSIAAQNRRGEWVPAIPLPYYVGRKRVACPECPPRRRFGLNLGRRFADEEAYRGHYALVHILGLD